MYKISTFLLMLVTSATVLFAQKGPGGVSVETTGPANSTCKVWYDISELNLADGDLVDTLQDVSLSNTNDFAWQDTLAYQPFYRTSVLNGRAGLQFSSGNITNGLTGKFLLMESSLDINLSKPMTERTIFLNFRTGDNVSRRQIIFEQGGQNRGINVAVHENKIYVSVHDNIFDPGDGTPAFNPVFVSNNIQPNFNYTVTLVFEGTVGSLNGTLRAYLNGVPFSSGVATGVGSIWEQVGPPAIGAVNGRQLMYDGFMADVIDSSNGNHSFEGTFGEMVYYSEILNDAERIIVENYLGVKYLPGTWANVKYSHQSTHGERAFGIGQENGEFHNVSQGSGIIEISGNPGNFQDGEYLMIADNGGSLSESTVNIPNSATNTKRVQREWKVDHTGNMGPITVRVEAADLPALDATYTKYVLIKDNKAGLTSRFGGSNVEVLELTDDGDGYYSVTTNLLDDSYLTVGLLKPEVSFTSATAYGFETNTTVTETVTAQLNYTPATTVTFDYNYQNNSAAIGSDYSAASPLLVTFNPGVRTANISVNILGDSAPENAETFDIVLQDAGNSTAEVNPGAVSTLEFSIYDDDNDPEVSFATDFAVINEDADSILVDVVRAGDPTPAFDVNIRLRTSGSGAGTATWNTDYTFTTPQTLSFASGEILKQVVLYVNDDDTDEDDESVFLELFGVNGMVDLVSSVEYELTILDDDVPPTVEFLDANYFAPESFTEPDIQVVLSAPSSKDVQVQYAINTTTSTATAVQDYNANLTGTLVIPAGDTAIRLPLFTLTDAQDEIDETVEIDLLNNGFLQNATLGAEDQHTFTIKDYQSFEWLGPAGVGRLDEIILWIDADRQAGNHNDVIDNLANFTNQAIDITRRSTANRAALKKTIGSGTVQGKATYQFDGNDAYDVTNTAILNGSASKRHYWLAIETGAEVTSRQVIYEQGGFARGLNIYIHNGNLYFHTYNDIDDEGPNSAWGPVSGTPQVVSTPVATNTAYVILAKYDITGATNAMELYVNGTLVGSIPAAGFPGLVYSHNKASVGALLNGLLHDNTSNPNYSFQFNGSISEIIAYTNAPINDAREKLINNYMSAKYALPLPGMIHDVTTVADEFGNNLAGIGSEGPDNDHLDAQGTSIVRINSASDISAGEYLVWHNNDNAITDSITSQLPVGFSSRLAQTFKAHEVGEVGVVNLSMNISDFDLGPYTIDDIELLISNDPNDFTAAVRHISGRSIVNGTVSFSGVDLNDGDYFTIGFAVNACIDGYWTGAVDNDWFNPNNWDCGEVPTSTIDVIIPSGVTNNPLVEGGNIYPVRDITVNAGGTIVNAALGALNGTLQVHGDFENNGSILNGPDVSFEGTTAQTITGVVTLSRLTIANPTGVSVSAGQVNVTRALNLEDGVFTPNGLVTIKSSATGTAYINDFSAGYTGSVSGDINVERFVNNTVGGFSYLGAMVGNGPLAISQFSDDFSTADNGSGNGVFVTPNPTCNPNSLAGNSAYGGLFDYVESNVSNCSQSGWRVRSAGNLEQGVGYAGIIPNSTTVDMTGNPNTGNKVISGLTNGGNANTSGSAGFNLISNPYPSPLNWVDVANFAGNGDLDGTAYLFDATGTYQGTYQPVNSLNNLDIASGQGFFVKVNTSNPTTPFSTSITIPQSARRTTSPNFFRGQASYDAILKLEVAGNGHKDLTTVAFANDFTTNFDRTLDARKRYSKTGYATLYTLTNGDNQAINALPNDGSVTAIPVGFKPGANGTYTFEANELSSFAPTALLLLEDLKTGTVQNLMEQNTYSFTADVNDDELRFVLHLVPEAVVATTKADCDGSNGSISVDLGTYAVAGGEFNWDAVEVINTADNSVIATANNTNGVLLNGVAANGGTYELTLTLGGYTATEVITVDAEPQVVADFAADATVVFEGTAVNFTNATQGATNFEWNFGDGNIDMATDPVHVFANAGTYMVSLNANNDVCSDAATQTVVVKKQTTTGIADVDDAPLVKVTAIKNSINIELKNVSDDNLTMNLFNLVGQRVIATQNIETAQSLHTITLNNVVDGYYFVELKGANTEFVQQVLIQQ